MLYRGCSMAKLPFDQNLIDRAKKLLEKKAVKNVLFSDGTYQIEVDDDESYWPFLQVSDDGELGDYFCSCEEAESGKCVHLAVAAMQILQKDQPLHVLFKTSLWNQLCQMAAKRHGYETDCIHKDDEGRYFCTSVTGKRLFQMMPKTDKGKAFLRDIIENRPVETEETSLKFSNLSSEELEKWRMGEPSHHLQYELSFWSDLGKGLLFYQLQNDAYSIDFGKAAPPKEMNAYFEDVDLWWYVAEINWPDIIPSLSTVHSPVPVFDHLDYAVEKIEYDEAQRQFRITGQKRDQVKQEGPSYELGNWIYQPGKGFFPKRTQKIIEGDHVPSEKVASMLEHYRPLLEKHLQGLIIDSHPMPLKYTLHFDDMQNLHIASYLFEPGDIRARFDHWAYVSKRGFFKLDQPIFKGSEMVVSKTDVSDFIHRHRVWLSQFEGFEIHLANIEAHLVYTFDRSGALCFESESELFEDTTDIIDFGEWVYIKDRGFYPKRQGRGLSALHPGLKVLKHEIAYFIRAHREELEQVQGFFTDHCPIEKMGLNISLDQLIHTDPEVFYKEGYKPEQVKIYGEFAYVEGEGFSEIPPDTQLPEGYSQPKTIDKQSEPYFVSYELNNLKPFVLYLDPRLQTPTFLKLSVVDIGAADDVGMGHWAVDLSYETESGLVDVVRIWEGLQNKQSYLFTEAGLIGLRQARFDWLRQIPKSRFIKGGRRIVLSTLEWIRLGIFENISVEAAKGSAQALLDEINKLQTNEVIDTKGLKSHLRPYQEKGLTWLWFLYCHGLSGLLCDDMGLGKTHQAMALIAAIKNKKRDAKILVVCPTSVIYHWEELLKNFLPHLDAHLYYGPTRSFRSADLILTSYGTFRSDKELFSHQTYDLAVLDELQVAKNPSSQTHKALKKLTAHMRLALSGTPIENRLNELKALFDIVLPTYFPSDTLYKETFVNPIEKNNDQEKKILLAKLIQPFLLRRKKNEVLEDLPEKIEEIAYCDLSKDQQELYQAAVYRERDALLHEVEQSDHPVPFLHIFALFSKLKQICDHPSLITGRNYTQHTSGKWDLFTELLEEIRDSGQKLVVFSQYLSMLDIVEHYLASHHIGFASIRGSTKNRKEQLMKFQNDPACEVFVASLQAAGVGIDLTAASVVIHFDRWWNPARENQATDRVHRIGQKRGVQVFKFVTKNTIEEHIHNIIERKRALTEELIAYDDQDQVKQLARDELVEILRSMKN